MRIPITKAAETLEAIRFFRYATPQEFVFCERMMDLYGCKTLPEENHNLVDFLVTIYHYGTVQGVRQERARRNKKRLSREVIEISERLIENPLLYQVMKIAVQIQSSEVIKQATDFLKGAKKNEDR